MRSGAGSANGYALAAKIVGLLYLGSRVQPEVELLVKVGDADEIGAAEPGVDKVAGPNDGCIDFTGQQCRDSQGIARHEDKLRVQAVLLKKPALLGHPN